MRLLVFFGFRHFERRLYGLFSFEFKRFFKQNCFFNDSGCFFGFRHFGKRFCGLFSDEFISFLKQNCFYFLIKVLASLASSILEDGSVAFFHMNF